MLTLEPAGLSCSSLNSAESLFRACSDAMELNPREDDGPRRPAATDRRVSRFPRTPSRAGVAVSPSRLTRLARGRPLITCPTMHAFFENRPADPARDRADAQAR
jgi:hypothetical protein